MNFSSKIPQKTLCRLYDYVNLCFDADELLYSLMCAKIVTVFSVLFDVGVLTFDERSEGSAYFRALAKERYGEIEK